MPNDGMRDDHMKDDILFFIFLIVLICVLSPYAIIRTMERKARKKWDKHQAVREVLDE